MMMLDAGWSEEAELWIYGMTHLHKPASNKVTLEIWYSRRVPSLQDSWVNSDNNKITGSFELLLAAFEFQVAGWVETALSLPCWLSIHVVTSVTSRQTDRDITDCAQSAQEIMGGRSRELGGLI